MNNSSKSPIKNVFLTLCLLNNTFNENLFYDKELHELKQDQDVIDKANVNPNNTIKDINKLPAWQIPVNWDRGRYTSPILRFLLRKYPHRNNLGFNHQSRSKGFPVRNHGSKYAVQRTKLLNYDSELTTITMDTGTNEIGEMSKINNETIVNQKNFFIILPETVKESHRKNYSQALNQVVKGGKGAANMVSDIIKTRVNKTQAKSFTLPSGIPQKVLDAIENTTCPVYVIHEGTTLLVMPKNKVIDNNRFTGTTTDKSETTMNEMDLIKSEISTSIIPSAISLFENVKNKSEIFVKTMSKKESTTKTKLQTKKVIIPSTFNAMDSRLRATTEKNKEKSSKTTSRSYNLTATILSAIDELNKEPKPNISVSTKVPIEHTNMVMTFLDTTCFPVLKISDKYSSTFKVIMMNQSDDRITRKTNKPFETKSNSVPNPTLSKKRHPTTLETTIQPTKTTLLTTTQMQQTSKSPTMTVMTKMTTAENTGITRIATTEIQTTTTPVIATVKTKVKLTTTPDQSATSTINVPRETNITKIDTKETHNTTKLTKTLTTEQDLTAVLNELNCENNCDETATDNNTLTTKQDLEAIIHEKHYGGTTKKNEMTTEQDLATAALNREEGEEEADNDNDDDDDDDEERACIDVKPTTCKSMETKTCRQDDETTQSYYKINNQRPKETSLRPTEEQDQTTRCNIPRRKQRRTTQMLHQNIFSPTHGKLRNSSLLVIKLISERPGDIEDQVQKVALTKSKHTL